MEWDVDGHEVLSLAAALIMAALAVVLLRASHERAQNRWFVALLAVEIALAVASPAIFVTEDPGVTAAAATAFMAALSVQVPVYLAFLSTLGTPVSRVLRGRALRIAPWALPAAALLALAIDRGLLVGRPDPHAQDVWATVGGPLLPVYHASYLLAAATGLVTALIVWRSSPRGTAMRRQGAAFALAFSLHDIAMIVAIVLGIHGGTTGQSGLLTTAFYVIPISKLVLVSLVTYGIVRTQLFDIDLKIKWTVGRGAALALLAGIFFVTTETIEFFLPGDGLVANLAGAAAVTALSRVAWRLGARLANKILPAIVETEEFRQARRVEVYRASLAPVAADGVVTERERRILEAMRDKLGISTDDADRIEVELMRQVAGGVSGSRAAR
jgi:hypothetical protein